MRESDQGVGGTLFERLAATRQWEPPVPDALGVLGRPGTPLAVSYSLEALDALDSQGDGGWWNEHRVRWALAALLERGVGQFLEVGAGSGAMARRLARAGLDVSAVEPLYEGARRLREAGGVPVFCGTLSDLALPDDSVPALGYFDVLEHLARPDLELLEACRVLESGGLLLVTVPAYQWLWSGEDLRAGHVRRYTRGALSQACESAGLVARRTEYLFASLVGPALLLRRLPFLVSGRRRPDGEGAVAQQLDPHPAVARFASVVLRAEAALAQHGALPFGLSVAGVFEKTGSDWRRR